MNLFRRETGLTQEQAKALIEEVRLVKRNLNEGGNVPYTSMEAIPFARSVRDAFVINERIDCFRLELHDARFLIFEVVMKPESQFGIHDHDAIERLWVLDGVCVVDGRQVRRFGARQFAKHQDHNVSSASGCRLLVIFSKEG